MPKAKDKYKHLTSEEWDEVFRRTHEQALKDLGLDKKPKKRRDAIWYYPRRDPTTGLIPHVTKPRKRSTKKSGTSKNTAMPPVDANVNVPLSSVPNDSVNNFATDNALVDHTCMTEGDEKQALLAYLQEAFQIDPSLPKNSTWSERQEDLEESWVNARPHLMKYILENQCPQEKNCQRCIQEPAVVRCRDCRQYLCQECDLNIHQLLFVHDRESWENGFFCRNSTLASIPVVPPVRCPGCNEEGQSALRSVGLPYIAITLKGRRKIPRAERYCTKCGVVHAHCELEMLISNGFWPGSIKRISYIFEADLLKFIDAVMNNMPGTSLTSVAKALQDMDESDEPVNKTSLSRALMEYRYCQQSLKEIQGIDGMSCPACSQGQHSAHVDGNFKVYRYRKVPRGTRKPYYAGVFIDPHEEVKKHMDTVYDRAGRSQDDSGNCGTSHWRAAKSSARGQSKLDECGLEVAGCRHTVAQKAVNMFTGEQYGYPHYIHVKFLLPLGVKYMWQDVICRYWPWATKQSGKNSAFSHAVESIKPALSVMHAKAHQWSCQVLWGGRNQEGSCAGAGEDMEQFFSYLSRLGSTTKNMSCAGREDTLTHHVFFWNSRKADNMAQQLFARYKRNVTYCKAAEEELATLKSSLVEEISETDLLQWQEEIISKAKASTKNASPGSKELERFFTLTAEKKAAEELASYVETQEQNSRLLGNDSFFQEVKQRSLHHQDAELQHLEESLCERFCITPPELQTMSRKAAESQQLALLQSEVEALSLSIRQRKLTINKLADSCKQRARLRRKNESERLKLETLLTRLSLLPGGEVLSRADAVNGKFPWHEMDSFSDTVPLEIKKKMVDVWVLLKRYKEEEIQLCKEMKSVVMFYQDKIACLQSEKFALAVAVNEAQPSMPLNAGRYTTTLSTHLERRGFHAIKEKGIARACQKLRQAVCMFSNILRGSSDTFDTFSSSSDSGDTTCSS